ncbi:hypothetical protein LCGC14_1314210, partial [marine sediment metagenome]
VIRNIRGKAEKVFLYIRVGDIHEITWR